MAKLAEAEPLSWLEIDLSAIRHNYRELRKRVSSQVLVFGVIKADAYGHGAVPTARALLDEGAPVLCVARCEEAAELRAAGIASRVLVFGPPLQGQAQLLVGLGCEAVVCAQEHFEALAAAARVLGKPARVHVKVDVGMGRLGVAPSDVIDFVRKVASYDCLAIAGVMSHLPCADTPERELTRRQIATFADVRETIEAGGFRIPCFHLANSAALLDFPESHFDAVRPGISLYGQLPSFDVVARPNLIPAMSMKSRVIFVKEVPPGTGLSYGHTFITTRHSRIATVPLGYADGYPRHASNKTQMGLRGVLAPQVGRVCMDLSLLDVTDIPEVVIGDEVLAFGRSGNLMLRAEEVADKIGTIGYELTTRVGLRLPRIYL
ncbi:MAG: alanine racemase [Candidatus Sumerlaeaceae bacterium]|jgi:alanine racemase